MAVRREYVSSLYRDILGREGSEQEIEGHLGNPGGEQGLYDLFTSVAGHGSDGRVNEATVGSPQQRAYQDQYDVQGAQPPLMPRNDAPVSHAPSITEAAPHTDQWSGQGSIAPSDNFGSMTGYDLTNWHDPMMQTLKYQAGRIGSRYSPGDPNALNYLMQDPDFKRMFPGARVIDPRSATIDFGGGQVIDVIQNFGAPNAKWAWQPIGSGSAGGGGAASGASSGTGGTLGDLRQLFGALGQQYGGPGDAGITKGPLQQVGQDPLSQLITGALADFIGRGGSTPFGQQVQQSILSMLGDGMRRDPSFVPGGEMNTIQGFIHDGNTIDMAPVGPDAGNVARRFESARELLDKGRRTMINDLEGDLVSRNLLSEPGIPQGIHAGGLQRITERIAPEFSRALRDIYSDEVERSDAKQMAALQMATSMSTDQARTFLAGIGEGTARQSALADIALRTLQTNMAWSQFLAEFGLKRDQVLAMLQQGRVDDVQELLNSFLSLASLSRGGYIGA